MQQLIGMRGLLDRETLRLHGDLAPARQLDYLDQLRPRAPVGGATETS